MSSFGYDEPRKESMQNFLDEIYKCVQKIGEGNHSSFIYRMLSTYGIDKKELFLEDGSKRTIEDCFTYWESIFESDKNIKVFCPQNFYNGFWEAFNSYTYPDAPYIKLYISLSSSHIKNGVEDLFNYIKQLGVSHASKVGKRVRNDNIIVRVNKSDKDAANKIIEFIGNNPYIKEGLNSPNPFVPCKNGIGYMIDLGGSYNEWLSNII